MSSTHDPVLNGYRALKNWLPTLVGRAYAWATRAECGDNPDGTVACGGSSGVGEGAITIGNVMIANDSLKDSKADPLLYHHEWMHTWQWTVGADFFVLSWLALGAANCWNPWEQAAGVEGTGYATQKECR